MTKQQMLKNNELSGNTGKSTTTEAINSATGSLFEGGKQRTFQGKRLALTPQQASEEEPSSCSHWGVVATIFEPSEAIARAAALPGWCLVIVADTKTPKDYMETLEGMLQNRTGNSHNATNVVYLNVHDQKNMEQQDTRTGAFIRAIPYGHFARKNIGYLYAIQRGAKLVFDFDDDNVLNPTTRDGKEVTSPLPNNNDTFLENARVAVVGNKRVLNHHPLMGASLATSWARGFPLSLIQDTTTHGFVAYQTNDTEANLENLAVLQFCANHDPDIDANYRLTQPQPMTFSASSPLVVPTHQTFVPYNAQATIHTQHAHWALLLPFTVPGRVSDIWRGYFAQALFRTLDAPLNMAFLPPSVTRQYRNSHNYLADAKAELDLYFKTDKLLEFLDNWRCSACTSANLNAARTTTCLAFCMEELWIELYERQYIEVEDVHMVQLWLSALMENGYNFPAMKGATKKVFDNVVLMGQFNYNADSSVRDILFWNQKWRQWFNRTVVRGPFHAQALQVLRAHGIDAFQGQDDKGRVSPMENLMRTVEQHQNMEGIAGVLYAHDDAIFNVPSLFQGFATSEQDHILANFDVRDPRKPENEGHADLVNKLSYKIIPQPDGGLSFLKQNGFQTNDTNQLVGSLLNWPGHLECIHSLSNLAKDPRSKRHRDTTDGSFMVPVKGQSDFFYVPIRLAEPFKEAAQLLLDHNVFLECAFPVLADMLQHQTTDPDGVAAIRQAKLCTHWDPNIRGNLGMLNTCGPREEVEVLHPIKMKQFGYKAWGNVVDLISRQTKTKKLTNSTRR